MACIKTQLIKHVGRIIRKTSIPAYMIAQGIGLSETQLARIIKKKNKPRQETVKLFERVEKLVNEALKVLAPKGAVEWIKSPNPYLSDVAPIQCLRSDKEVEKVMSVLAAIKYGFPA